MALKIDVKRSAQPKILVSLLQCKPIVNYVKLK